MTTFPRFSVVGTVLVPASGDGRSGADQRQNDQREGGQGPPGQRRDGPHHLVLAKVRVQVVEAGQLEVSSRHRP